MEKTLKIASRKAVEKLKPYSPGKPIWEVQRELGISHVIKLASNENPLGPSPKAVEAISSSLGELHRYPDAQAYTLKQALADAYRFAPEEIIVGNGADELITLISETFLEAGDEIIVPSPSFSEYEFGADLMGAVTVPVSLGESYNYSVEALLAAVTPKTKAVYICSPNNPTGTYMTKSQLQKLLEALPEHILVIFDSAYTHFATEEDYTDGFEFIKMGYPVIVLQTFSKIYGLAGIRVGFAIGKSSLIDHILRVKEPFNVNSLAQTAAVAALSDHEHVEKSRSVNAAGREQLYEGLHKLQLQYTKSMANFVLIHLGQDAKAIYDGLMAKGIIVRYAGIWGMPEYIRVSVGNSGENEAFLKALEEVLA